MRFIDLFSGIGACHQSLNKLNFECVFASDIDKNAKQFYQDNYGIQVSDNIRDIKAEEIPEFDILCAGIPCQPFSISGSKEGFKDEIRGTLFFEVIRILKHHKPRYVMIENVKNLNTHDNGNTLKTILKELEDCDYHIDFKVLNAVNFGVPQCRERIYFIGIRKDIVQHHKDFSLSTIKTIEPKKVRSIIDFGDTTDERDKLTQRYDFVKVEKTNSKVNKPQLIYKLVSKESMKGGRQGERIYDIDNPGITICKGSGGPGSSTGLYMVSNSIRTLNVKETFKMFGFPPDMLYVCSDKQMIGMLGNSICIPVLDAIFNSLFPQQV